MQTTAHIIKAKTPELPNMPDLGLGDGIVAVLAYTRQVLFQRHPDAIQRLQEMREEPNDVAGLKEAFFRIAMQASGNWNPMFFRQIANMEIGLLRGECAPQIKAPRS